MRKNEWHNGVQAIYTYNESLGNVIQNENVESWDLTTTTWKK